MGWKNNARNHYLFLLFFFFSLRSARFDNRARGITKPRSLIFIIRNLSLPLCHSISLFRHRPSYSLDTRALRITRISDEGRRRQSRAVTSLCAGRTILRTRGKYYRACIQSDKKAIQSFAPSFLHPSYPHPSPSLSFSQPPSPINPSDPLFHTPSPPPPPPPQARLASAEQRHCFALGNCVIFDWYIVHPRRFLCPPARARTRTPHTATQ